MNRLKANRNPHLHIQRQAATIGPSYPLAAVIQDAASGPPSVAAPVDLAAPEDSYVDRFSICDHDRVVAGRKTNSALVGASIRASIDARLRSVASLGEAAATIERITTSLARTLRRGGKVLTCGNGGSAAEALHLAEEMMGRFRRDRAPLAAICLSADPTALTCIANDYGFEEIFARQVEGLGRKGDALVALSTSGESPNVVRALKRARQLDLTTIGMLGEHGSAAEKWCDLALVLTTMDEAQRQEAHLMAIHVILEHLDARVPSK
jgi:D-sedoheptulose 7-phosphate isomerase